MQYELGPTIPKTWELRCSECFERLTIQLPADTEAGFSGLIFCEGSHMVAFRFDGATVVKDAAFEVRHSGARQARR